MRTLIAIQEEAIARLNEPRSSERRHAKYRGVVRRWFFSSMHKHLPGYTNFHVALAWEDAIDIWALRRDADA